MAPSRMVGWHQLGGGFEGNGHGLVLAGTRPSKGSGSLHGVANPSQKMESVSALLKSSPQAGISYIRRRLYFECEDSIPWKRINVDAKEEHYTVLTNGDRALNRYCVIGCCLQVENTTFFKHLLL